MNLGTLPTVAIVGRPNVGKSTLFNALLGERRAIVSDIPGTTRDSVVARIDPREQFGPEGTLIPYLLVDTAGLTNTKGESLEEAVKIQVMMAMEKADIILFTLDGKSLLTSEDEDLIKLLRKKSKKVVLLINKVDDGNPEKVREMRNIGFGEPLLISGKNFFGIWDLQDRLQEHFLEQGFEKPTPPAPETLEALEAEEVDEALVPETPSPEEVAPIRLAIVGRPNVGKSSLFNQLVGHERAIVSEIPGTTRDTLDEEIIDETGQRFLLVDSAGLRRPGKIGFQNIEYWSKVRTSQAIENSDVCILLIDALEGIAHQDLAVVNTILEAGKGLIFGVNKFDLVREKTRGEESDERVLEEVEMWEEDLVKVKEDYLKYVRAKAGFLSWASILFFSAKTGKGVKEILEKAKEVALSRKKRIDTSELNRFLLEIYHGHVAPSKGPKQGKMKFASQVDTCPPKFLFFVNNATLFHFSYKRYVENKIRAKYGFEGTPLHIEFRDEREKREKK